MAGFNLNFMWPTIKIIKNQFVFNCFFVFRSEHVACVERGGFLWMKTNADTNTQTTSAKDVVVSVLDIVLG